jgi:hypothetical protein
LLGWIPPVAAQGGDLSKFFSVLGGMSGADGNGNAARAIGERIVEAVYPDDPAAEDAIRDWYAKQTIRLPPPSPAGDAAAKPPAPSAELLDLLSRASTAASSATPAAANDSAGGCTRDAAIEAIRWMASSAPPTGYRGGTFTMGAPSSSMLCSTQSWKSRGAWASPR